MTARVSTRDRDLGDVDVHLLCEGTHLRLGDKLGAHLAAQQGVEGTWFAVYAPNAASVSVVGEFNGWKPGVTPLARHPRVGVFRGFVPNIAKGALYKYHIVARGGRYAVDKADPFGLRHEASPGTASVVWDVDYRWRDEAWMALRAERSGRGVPMSIYEVHLGSWMRVPEEGNRFLRYDELAPKLVDYVRKVGFTHVELMPLAEHPFYGSWGYETTGYFAPTNRYGTPEQLMALIDALHQAGIGVIIDWVPAHFPTDEHGLVYFDGTHLFEHADPRRGFHPEWNTSIFDYGKREVRSFLLSSAFAWVERFHADGLRVDGVASMLYLDYGRRGGEWLPNEHGGHENLEAVAFLREFNRSMAREHPEVITIAEESTAWPKVTGPVDEGGLGFTFKWDMGWMHDTLSYFARDPVHRKWHHRELTMRGLYANSEAFVLPLSHDEVVHGKGSLLRKMHGDLSQKLAQLRLLFAYMYSQPGKKLIFMGDELAPWSEWNHDKSLDWHLLDEPPHRQIQLTIGELNRLYRTEPALAELDCSPAGFTWIYADDAEQSVLSYERISAHGERILVVLNFAPVTRNPYRVGVETPGIWEEVFNSDAVELGGSGVGNLGGVEASPFPWNGRPCSLNIVLPALSGLFFRKKISGAPVLG